jgi:serine/threonine protein phosphatase 1
VLRFLRKQRPKTGEAKAYPPVLGEGLLYAVGDVHGCNDLLIRLVENILEDAARSGQTPVIVFLGDYIDRGEGACQTIELLTEIAGWPEAQSVFLMGNHEQMLLRFLREPESGKKWLRFGGLQTLMSYGIGSAADMRGAGSAAQVAQDLAKALGPHLGFIEGLRLSYRSGNLLFAHAGADPALPADEQEVATLLWGCPAFLETERTDGIWVVHGHTIVDLPIAARGRISVDTGAYFSGRLTAARIIGDEVSFLQA